MATQSGGKWSAPKLISTRRTAPPDIEGATVVLGADSAGNAALAWSVASRLINSGAIAFSYKRASGGWGAPAFIRKARRSSDGSPQAVVFSPTGVANPFWANRGQVLTAQLRADTRGF